MTPDRYEELLDYGRRNQEIVNLARGWCTHIRFDKGHMGVGIPEQMTGLPISGGTFRCDYARGLSPSAMDLPHIGLDFYQRNCKGCPHRNPGGTTPNLGTWAEEQLRIDTERKTEAGEAQEERRKQREKRRADRRLIAGKLNAEGRAILDLVDRLDQEEYDSDARKELLAAAELHPDGFGDDLLQLLAMDALAAELGACLEAVVIVHERTGRPEQSVVLSAAMASLRSGSAPRACGRVLAQYLEKEHVEELQPWFPEIVAWAGPLEPPWGDPPRPEPAALLRCHDVAPQLTEDLLGSELRRGEDYRRGAAAGAVSHLITRDTATGMRLLSPLLDSLKFTSDDPLDDDQESSGRVAVAVMDLLLLDPVSVDRAIANTRWERATVEYKRALFKPYSLAGNGIRWRDKPMSDDAASTIASRAASLLMSEDAELLSEASDAFRDVCSGHPRPPVDMAVAFGLLALLRGRIATFDAEEGSLGPPIDQLEALNRLTTRQGMGIAIGKVHGALAGLGKNDPETFWRICRETWDGADSTLRAELLEVIGGLGRSQSVLRDSLPLMYSGMFDDDVSFRAAGFRCLSEVVPSDIGPLPEEVTEAVLAGVQDKYLAVVKAAVECLVHVHVPQEKRRSVTLYLLGGAASYAADRLQDRFVEECLRGALRLSRGEDFEQDVMTNVLLIIKMMPSYEALERLRHFASLKKARGWIDTALHALRLDEHPSYARLGAEDRSSLLRELVQEYPNALKNHLEELESIGRQELPGDRQWAWQVADALSCMQEYGHAHALASDIVQTVPATPEMKRFRLFAQQVECAHRLERMIDEGNEAAIEDTFTEWANVEEEASADEEAHKDARGPFVPSNFPK